MSYTNQTQHYGLPQYVGTDVPAWLTDVNGAFATIDQGMNAAKTQADSAATAAGQASNDIVSINSTLGTQAGQISAAAGAAAAAQTTANSADGKADANAQSISGLDTRVTALEEGGGGGTLFVTRDVEFSATDIIKEAPTVPGHTPVFAVEKTGYGSGGISALLTKTGSGTFIVCRYAPSQLTTGSNVVVFGGAQSTVTVYYLATT